MLRRTNPSSFGIGWDLVDTEIRSVEDALPLRQVLDLAVTDWQSDTLINLEVPATERLLTQHRILTLIPSRNVPEGQRKSLADRLIRINGVQMRIEAAAAEVLSLFEQAGIETRVLKGLASAELDYPSRNLRQTGDIDLALPQHQLDEAVCILKRRSFVEHDESEWRYLTKGVTLHSPQGVEVDLHTRLFLRSSANVDLFADPGQAVQNLGGRALCLEHRLVHAAGHFIVVPQGQRRMSGLIDIARMRSQPSLDLEKSRQFAAAIGVESLVGAALRLEAQLSGRLEGVLELESWRQPDWLERATRLSPQRRLVLDHFVRFRQVPRSDWLRYLPLWLSPTRRQRQLFVQAVRRSSGEAVKSFRPSSKHP